MITNATSLKRMMRLTLLESATTRLAFDGVAEFYQALHDGYNPFFYVSSSPWNLYEFLTDFFRHNEIVQGPLMLRDFGIDENKFITGSHQLQQIRSMIDLYPTLPFILCGESGQDDPEIYAAITDEYPDQIRTVYIRDVSDHWRNAFIQRLIQQLKDKNVDMLLVPDTLAAAAHAMRTSSPSLFAHWQDNTTSPTWGILFMVTGTMIVPVMGAIAKFLGEKTGWHRKAAVLAGFLGALLVIQPGSDTFTMAALLPMYAAFFFSCYLIVTRSVANIDHPLIMQFALGFGAAVALSLVLLAGLLSDSPQWIPVLPDLVQWGWLMLIGLIAAAGHLLVVIAVNRAPASLLAPFGYVEIIAATVLGWLVFDDWPDALSWVGIAIIVLSGLYVFVREQRQAGISSPSTN